MMGWLTRRLRTAGSLGNKGERHAASYLRRQGFKIVARQQSSRLGEIDLIARDGQCIVFVEVPATVRSLKALAPPMVMF